MTISRSAIISRPSGKARVRLLLLRHGQSESNRDWRFTGWSDVSLTARGREEARRAGEALGADGLVFGACYSSCLRRASETARIVLEAMGQGNLPVQETWRLNERHYGALEGLRWWQGILRFGPVQVVRCRRSHEAAPPLLRTGDPGHPANDPRYGDVPRDQLPGGESLRDAQARLAPVWEGQVALDLRRGVDTLVVAHKNILRAFLRLLSQASGVDVGREVIHRCEPILFELDTDLRIVRRHIGGRD